MVDWEKSAPEQQPGQPEQPTQAPPSYQPPPFYQPPPYYGPPPGYGYPPAFTMLPPHMKPSNNIGWAIAAILTFWPLAIPAFIASAKVDDLWFRGDAAGAQRASADARRYGIIALCVTGGMVLLFFVFVLFAFGLFAATV